MLTFAHTYTINALLKHSIIIIDVYIIIHFISQYKIQI